jgi:hypothetical protein
LAGLPLKEAALREGRAPASPGYWGVAALRPSALPCFSPFNIQNSQFIPLFFQSGLIGLNQGKSEQKNKRIFAKNEHKVHMDNNLC